VADDARRRDIVDLSTGRRLSGARLDHIVECCARNTTREAFGGYLKAFCDGGFADRVRGLPTPVLAIVGEHDLAITPAVTEATCLQWYPNARLRVAANAGHYPMQEVPVWLATEIESFTREHA
jgi:pimeloyl-ACP methyl ester carboxylesterase